MVQGIFLLLNYDESAQGVLCGSTFKQIRLGWEEDDWLPTAECADVPINPKISLSPLAGISKPVRNLNLTPRVQVPNNHILSKILTYIATILKPST